MWSNVSSLGGVLRKVWDIWQVLIAVDKEETEELDGPVNCWFII